MRPEGLFGSSVASTGRVRWKRRPYVGRIRRGSVWELQTGPVHEIVHHPEGPVLVAFKTPDKLSRTPVIRLLRSTAARAFDPTRKHIFEASGDSRQGNNAAIRWSDAIE